MTDRVYSVCRWRVGRSIGRTIYAVMGPQEGDDDRPIGMLDTRELAAEAVRAHNVELDAQARIGRRLLTGGDEPEHVAREKVLGKTVAAIHHEIDDDGERLTLEFPADGAEPAGTLVLRASLTAPGTIVASWAKEAEC